MNGQSSPEFSALLTAQQDFSVCVKCAKESVDTDAPRVDYLYLRFKEATPDEAGLAEIVYHQIVNYAIPRKKIRELIERSQSNPLDFSLHSKIFEEAKRAFIRYDSKATGPMANIRYGEIGEVIAFCVASHFLTAGQVAAKMALKTNAEMPVFGLDGIHVRGESDGTITVYFMEAKVVGEAESGAEQYAKSAGGFDNDRKHKLNEQRIARDLSNFDMFEGALREAALNYFDPYGQASENVRERFVGVVVYSEPLFGTKIPVNDATPLDAHEKHFVKSFESLFGGFKSALEKALKSHSAEPGRCRAFFLAVPDTGELKKRFAQQMANEHIR
ncbi:DUF1837 domain-containing protein [Phragmitibacter flavus]|uniref:DUF1837 domain-containing protein n=1 Tax=Phragmitibacter flavus TaxID=2576071 RepID=A0A5R8K9I3_9BACT|nr:DUF1837 domain-containing protein [Phragmitibacter flavus]TLD68957.1 DUF1837 domain-containing protein [Phragmitibacter flavus]